MKKNITFALFLLMILGLSSPVTQAASNPPVPEHKDDEEIHDEDINDEENHDEAADTNH